MKNIASTIAIVMITLTVALTGCTKDSNTTPDPGRSSFIGKWSVSPTKLTYEVTISADPNSSTGVFISNFAMIGTTYPPAGASIKGNTITLDANQVIGNGLTINGSGTLSGTKIAWHYTIFDGADLTTVNETYTRE